MPNGEASSAWHHQGGNKCDKRQEMPACAEQAPSVEAIEQMLNRDYVVIRMRGDDLENL